MRLSWSTPEEIDFAKWLLDVGHGRNISTNGIIPFDIDMQVPDRETLINNIYPNIYTIIPPA